MQKKAQLLCKKILIIVCLLCLLVFPSCNKESDTTVVFTTGFSKNEIFRIEESSCTLSEIMVYLVNMENQYENVFGKEIWELDSNGVSLQENIKDTGLAKIAQIKTMNLLAKEKNVILTEEEKELAREAATEYFQSLNEKEIEIFDVDISVLKKMYEEYALAEKVYHYIIQDINPEISDDEARIVTVQQIYFATSTFDGAGAIVPYSSKAEAEAFETAQKVLLMAKDVTYEFEELAREYSETTEITLSFGKGEVDPKVEDAAFHLGKGEVSSIVEGELGYYILKCLNTYDREQTDANKLKIMEERKQEVFGQEYDAFVDTLTRNLNKKLWNKVTLVQDEEVVTSDFFMIYQKYFHTLEE